MLDTPIKTWKGDRENYIKIGFKITTAILKSPHYHKINLANTKRKREMKR